MLISEITPDGVAGRPNVDNILRFGRVGACETVVESLRAYRTSTYQTAESSRATGQFIFTAIERLLRGEHVGPFVKAGLLSLLVTMFTEFNTVTAIPEAAITCTEAVSLVHLVDCTKQYKF